MKCPYLILVHFLSVKDIITQVFESIFSIEVAIYEVLNFWIQQAIQPKSKSLLRLDLLQRKGVYKKRQLLTRNLIFSLKPLSRKKNVP